MRKVRVNEEPVYNIGIVARMTGVPENTLRVWERRYDFPQSARTEGGHRLGHVHAEEARGIGLLGKDRGRRHGEDEQEDR